MKRNATNTVATHWEQQTPERVSFSLTPKACQRLEAEAQRRGISPSELIEQLAQTLPSEPQTTLHPLPLSALPTSAEPTQVQEQATVLKALLTTSVDHIYVFDRRGRYRYISHSAAQAIGCEPEAVIGRTWQELKLRPDLMRPVDRHREWVMATGQPIRAEAEHQDFEGDRYCEYILSPWYSDSQKVEGVLAIARDITDRKQVEVALREKQHQLEVALQTAKLGSWQFELATKTLTCSAQCKANFGLPPDAEFTHDTLHAALHPEDRILVNATIERSLAEGIDYEVDERCFWPDGSLHWLIARGRLIYDEQGNPVRMVGVTLDITERKQFEESLKESHQRLVNILESMTDGFIAFDRDWRYTYVNCAAAQMFGRSPEAMLGHRWQTLFPEVARQNTVITQNFERVMRDRVWVHFEAFSQPTQRWVEMSVFPADEGIAVFFRDVSDRKQAEQERESLLQKLGASLEAEQAAREQAEAANQIKDEFLAVLSHELRSPLNPILGWSKLLRENKLTGQAAERALEVIERNAKLQTQLIDDLLDISRILRGKLALNLELVNLEAVIQAALETVRFSAQTKGVNVHILTAPNVGLVLGDFGRLQQIVWNLLSNAVKFTPSGGQVKVKLERVELPNLSSESHTDASLLSPPASPDYAQITVTDTGVGINPAFLPHVFDAFRQADGKSTRKFGGLGLGLAIVRHLTEIQGGRVHASSPGEGQGTTFTLVLPLTDEATFN